MSVTGANLAKATDTAFADPDVKNLVVGEAIHARNDFFRLFVSPENMDSMKRNGVTEIAVELPKIADFTIRSLNEGRITPEQFKSNLKAQIGFYDMDESTAAQRRDLIVDMVQRAHERGIKVKFVDDLKGTQEMDKFREPQNQKRLEACYEKKLGAMTDTEIDAFAKNMVARMLQMGGECLQEDPALKALAESIDKGRLEGDKKLGKEAAERNPQGRTIFFYGNAHGEGIASGHPGKSSGIVGVYDQNADGIREMTPFFKYQFNIDSGETNGPPQSVTTPPTPSAHPASAPA